MHGSSDPFNHYTHSTNPGTVVFHKRGSSLSINLNNSSHDDMCCDNLSDRAIKTGSTVTIQMTRTYQRGRRSLSFQNFGLAPTTRYRSGTRSVSFRHHSIRSRDGKSSLDSCAQVNLAVQQSHSAKTCEIRRQRPPSFSSSSSSSANAKIKKRSFSKRNLLNSVRRPSKDKFKARRERSTAVLVGIVVVFVICHSMRFSLQLYKVCGNPGR